MSDSPSTEERRFDTVDWSSLDPTTTDRGSRRTVVAVLLPLVVAAAFAVDYLTADGPPASGPTALDWLLIGAAAVLVSVGLALVGDTQRVREQWSSFRRHRLAVAGLVYLVGFFAVGLVGPLYFTEPKLNVLVNAQPPVWGSIDVRKVPQCAGVVVDGRCRGTLEFLLGTTARTGKDLVPLVVFGIRSTVTVVLGAAALIVPTGIVVGVVAATVGGRVESGLMWISEVLQTFPAILVYFTLFWVVVDGRLVLLTVVLGLVSWGGVARLVRNEIRERSDELFVQAATVGGLDRWQTVRRHLLPNVGSSLVTTVTLQVPLFVILEASVSFVRIPVTGGTPTTLGDPSVVSLGQLVYQGFFSTGFPVAWWVGGIPAVLLVCTVLSFNLVGDALADVLDPQ